MRRIIIKPRSSVGIVQQMNTITTKDALRQLAQGSPIEIPQGSSPRSYDFDDQSKVDFDKPRFGQFSNPQFDGFENLIDQHINANKIAEHLSPPAPPVPSVDPPSAPPVPPVDPPTAE